MDRILSALGADARVLDLAAQHGSYDAARYPFTTYRVDLDPPAGTERSHSVGADAARLPFADNCFDAVVCNHGLEHFEQLEAAVSEMGRTLKPDGALFLTVPDAGTLTDRLYRFLARGGGHVNRFRSPGEVVSLIGRVAALPCRGRRTLFTSLSFVHPANRGPGRNRRLLVLFGAGERALRWTTWLFRIADKSFGTRLSIYGWAFYFGAVPRPGQPEPWSNVCVRCGAGVPSAALEAGGAVRPSLVAVYACPRCGTRNLFTQDAPFSRAE